MPGFTALAPSRVECVEEDHGYDTPCHIWQGATNRDGYGIVRINGKHRGPHRVRYEREVGPIPEGLVLDHLCRVRLCTNPEHLEPVTNWLNRYRGRLDTLPTHCKHGHEYTPENTYIEPRDGARSCRTCHREREAIRRAS